MERTLTSETPKKIGETVLLKGWIAGRRDHGKLIFIDVRDRWGIVQVVFTPADAGLLKEADRLRPEWVVAVGGTVKERPKGMENPDTPTGAIEIEATDLEILSKAKTPPFALDTNGYEIGEEHRLKYRYLDLRRPRLQKNLFFRDKAISHIRGFLHERDFIEIETPHITKSTPEGARDFVVPSRLYPGKFYALPQSPQQYKELLMVAGFERYFQIARAFRDEDTRGDRQPEHTQLDIEMSFVEREDVLALIEKLLIDLVGTVAPEKRIAQIPFPRLTHGEATAKYSSDKPDLRADKNDPNELAFCWVIDFPLFERDKKTGGMTYSHNPFTAPKPEYADDLREGRNLEKIVSQQYDVVLNGFEVGSGSIRISNSELLKKVFLILGHGEEKIRKDFGHMLEAFSYGVPPHGGIACGLDRVVMILQNEPNIREVIAFPKTGDARDLMMDAPSDISEEQMKELHIRITK
ncbi:MAG: aspartate--tRNA ligase [Candidatus Sungbacteria bacterium]|nr:aspartate--tRNA ligase [Candidatus Sungbacteria bacterium]